MGLSYFHSLAVTWTSGVSVSQAKILLTLLFEITVVMEIMYSKLVLCQQAKKNPVNILPPSPRVNRHSPWENDDLQEVGLMNHYPVVLGCWRERARMREKTEKLGCEGRFANSSILGIQGWGKASKLWGCRVTENEEEVTILSWVAESRAEPHRSTSGVILTESEFSEL